MSVVKFPIERQWVAQTLIPYLRYAFSHILPYNADLTAQVGSAIDFCQSKPDYPTDGNDLLFERIVLAIEHRHKNFESGLSVVTDNLEPLARFLIRRAQLKGPYELLGRDSRPSEAWLEFDGKRLLEVHGAYKGGQGIQGALTAVTREPATLPPPKSIPTEEVIDPRLLNAQPGQYTSPKILGSMTFAEDQYYRRQNQLVEEHRAKIGAAQQRASKAFSSLSKRKKAQHILELYQMQQVPDVHVTMPSPIHGLPIALPSQPLSSPAAPVFSHVSRQAMFLPPPPQQSLTYRTNGEAGRGFVHHPGYSNIVSAFPPAMYDGMSNVSERLSAQVQQKSGGEGSTKPWKE